MRIGEWSHKSDLTHATVPFFIFSEGFQKKRKLPVSLQTMGVDRVSQRSLTYDLFYDKLGLSFHIAAWVRAALNREAGERPALSRSCNAEPTA